MRLSSLLISIAIFGTTGPAFSQDITTLYTMTDAQMTDRFELDEFRVTRMQELIQGLPEDVIREQLRTHMSERTKTVLHYDEQFVFAEYSTADGRIYTWMPDSESVSEGTWRISDEADTGLSVCFQVEDGNPECIPAAYILAEHCALAIDNADTFGLSTGALPFTRQRLDVPGVLDQ